MFEEESNPGLEAERGKAFVCEDNIFGVGGAMRMFFLLFIGDPAWKASSSVAAVLLADSDPAVAIRFL